MWIEGEDPETGDRYVRWVGPFPPDDAYPPDDRDAAAAGAEEPVLQLRTERAAAETDGYATGQVDMLYRHRARAEAEQAVCVAELNTRRLAAFDAAVAAAQADGTRLGQAGLADLAASIGDAAAEVGPLCNLTPHQATRLVHVSVTIIGEFRLLAGLWIDGRLDRAHMDAFLHVVDHVSDPTHRAGIEAWVVAPMLADPHAVLTTRAVAARARQAWQSLDPDAATTRHRRRLAHRGIWIDPLPDGMARLIAEGDATQIQELYDAITTAAATLNAHRTNTPTSSTSSSTTTATSATAPTDTTDAADTARAANTGTGTGDSDAAGDDAADDEPVGGDRPTGHGMFADLLDRHRPTTDTRAGTSPPETGHQGTAPADIDPDHDTACRHRRLGQDRFDALLLIARGILADPDCLTHAPTRPDGAGISIRVTVAATTLAGLDDQPAHLSGHGAIPASTARHLAATADFWTRLLTDPVHGTLTHADSRRYTPPPGMRRTLLARDSTCCFPGCDRPATSPGIEIDHHTPWPTGPTALWNLGPLCKYHHLKKTLQKGWKVHRLPDGTIDWISPTGHHHRRPPDHLGLTPAALLNPALAGWLIEHIHTTDTDPTTPRRSDHIPAPTKAAAPEPSEPTFPTTRRSER